MPQWHAGSRRGNLLAGRTSLGRATGHRLTWTRMGLQRDFSEGGVPGHNPGGALENAANTLVDELFPSRSSNRKCGARWLAVNWPGPSVERGTKLSTSKQLAPKPPPSSHRHRAMQRTLSVKEAVIHEPIQRNISVCRKADTDQFLKRQSLQHNPR